MLGFLLIGLLAVLLAAALTLLALSWRRSRDLHRKFAPIIDAQAEVARAKAEADQLRAAATLESDRVRAETTTEAERVRTAAATEVEVLTRRRQALSEEYAAARAIFDRLKHELALVEENVEQVSVGLYRPHYAFDSSEAYKKALDEIREKQKALVREGRAAICGKTWRIEGDKRAGERMTKQYLKLVLRAFNGECDAAIAKVTWNNVTRMEERIRKAQEALNDLGGVMDMRIGDDYLALKLAELRLEYETDHKKREEQEEQRRIKEQMREEERALREAEKAKQDAEDEEARYQKALERARAELAKAKGESLELLQTKIEQLDAALHRAQEMKEKASSMAQLTRSGHVYVISNVGSFGDNVFKIGMTRRLEPMDRIKELGDASVPFDFDVHAMVYSTDAPTLESRLQSRFSSSAVNLVNPRKEFFAVSIDEIASFVNEIGLDVTLTRLAEAKEYRETLARRTNPDAEAPPSAGQPALPSTI